MADKNEVDVLINKKKYTLCANENPEYIQKLASFVDGKYKEFGSFEASKNLGQEKLSIFVEINLADDYFKLQQQFHLMELEMEQKENEIYRLKQQLIECQGKNDLLNQELEKEKNQKIDADKKIVELKTTLLERGLFKESDEKKAEEGSGTVNPAGSNKAENHSNPSGQNQKYHKK